MALTEKQEKFCVEYIRTGNASEAYRQAYDASSMTPDSINRKAKEVMDNVKIAARLEELRAPVRERAQITLESHLSDLKRLRDRAEEEGKFAAAISAEVNRGKASGLYIEKLHVGLDESNPIMDLIKAVSGKTLDPK